MSKSNTLNPQVAAQFATIAALNMEIAGLLAESAQGLARLAKLVIHPDVTLEVVKENDAKDLH